MAKLERYRKAAETGDETRNTFVSYAVTKKSEGKYRLSRIMMVLGYILVDIVYLFLILVLTKIPMLGAFVPLITWALVYFTWPYVSVEYEYTIDGGVLTAREVFGSRKCRTLASARISSMTRIAPYPGEFAKEADRQDAEKIYCVSSMSSPDVYFAVFKDENWKDTVLFFEAAEKTLKVIKYYNPEVVMTKTRY